MRSEKKIVQRKQRRSAERTSNTSLSVKLWLALLRQVSRNISAKISKDMTSSLSLRKALVLDTTCSPALTTSTIHMPPDHIAIQMLASFALITLTIGLMEVGTATLGTAMVLDLVSGFRLPWEVVSF